MRAGIVNRKAISLERNSELYRMMPEENTSISINAAKNVPNMAPTVRA